MPRSLYSPRLSDDVVRALYREGQRCQIPMTRLADQLLRQALGAIPHPFPTLHVCGDEPVEILLNTRILNHHSSHFL